MPNLMIDEMDPALFAKLRAWASEQHKTLPELARDILAAAQRTHEKFDPTVDQTTRDIRRCRDGGCGLCDELEPILGKVAA